MHRGSVFWAVALAMPIAALATMGACAKESSEDCPVGSEGCACTDGDSCDGGLECRSDTCVTKEGGGSGGDDPSGGSGGSEVECQGEVFDNGFCYQACTYDVDSPNNEAGNDCAPMGAVCLDLNVGVDYCTKRDCVADADCGAGQRCATETLFSGVQQTFCRVDCSGGSACPEGEKCSGSCPSRLSVADVCMYSPNQPFACE